MTEEHKKLNTWIALNVTKTLRRLSAEEYDAVVAMCDEANEEPHPNLELTTPWRFVGCCPNYSTNAASAMQVLEHCMKHLARLTGRADFQIVVLHDEGSPEPYCVTTDSTKDSDDSKHVENCASAETMELAICRFCKNLHTGNRVAESANDKVQTRRD